MFTRFTASFAAAIAAMPLLVPVAGVGAMLCLSSGCGSGNPSVRSLEFPLASRTRALQAGDSWTYRVSVENSDYASSSTETVRIASATFEGSPALTRTATVDFDDETAYTIEYLKQTETRELIALGALGYDSTVAPPDSDIREVRPLVEPQPFLFGEWMAGKELTYQLQYGDQGLPTEGKLVIVGTEKVRTPLGIFDTWKVQGTTAGLRNFGFREGTYWYAPQLGTIVKEEETIRGFEQYAEVTRTLVATNLPLSVLATSAP